MSFDLMALMVRVEQAARRKAESGSA